jgi:hypothetical protein
MCTDNFWLGFITAVAALAGFTLASYSIFVSRIEIAAADTICRRYLFKEYTSQYSLAHILFALTMFVVPLALGLSAVLPFQLVDESWRVAVRMGEAVFVLFIGFINWKQVEYGWLFIRYNMKLKEKRKEFGENRASGRSHASVHFVLECTMLLVSWAILFVNLWHLNGRLMRAGVWNLNSDLLLGLANAISAELGAVLSLLVALALVSWHFYLFDPARLVFKVDPDTKRMLLETQRNIESSLMRLGPLRDWLRWRIITVRGILDDTSLDAIVQVVPAMVLIYRAETYLDGKTSSLKESEEATLESRGAYHMACLEFCKKQPFLVFVDIVWFMNGVEMYIQALSNFELRLKEMPGQLTALFPLQPEGRAVPRRSA